MSEPICRGKKINTLRRCKCGHEPTMLVSREMIPNPDKEGYPPYIGVYLGEATYFVKCLNCEKRSKVCKTEKGAKISWNRRVSDGKA